MSNNEGILRKLLLDSAKYTARRWHNRFKNTMQSRYRNTILYCVPTDAIFANEHVAGIFEPLGLLRLVIVQAIFMQ